jgi:hypothetical protein
MLDALMVLGWVETSGLDSLRNVVAGLLGLEDSRARQLTRIESKVDAMLDSPYRSALDYLASAQRAGLDIDKGKSYLESSIHDFRRAAANYEGVAPRRASWACLHLLLLYTALGDTPEAQEWGARSYEAAIRWAREEVRAFEKRYQLRRGRWSLFTLATAAYLILAIVIAFKGNHGYLAIGPSHSAFVTITLTYVIFSSFLLIFSKNLYHLVVSILALRQMQECARFLDEVYRVWVKLSANPEAVEFYMVGVFNDSGSEWSFIKTYEVVQPSRPLDPSEIQLLRHFNPPKNTDEP